MKSFLILVAMFLSVQGFAQSKMGPEAVEMFKVISHPSVQECVRDTNFDLANLEIAKLVARCPGCTHYKVTGFKKHLDVATKEKVTLTINGRSVPGTFRGWIQFYTCDLKEEIQ